MRPFWAGVSFSSIAPESIEKRSFAAVPEPLPFDDEPRVDEFSNYIDETIQMM